MKKWSRTKKELIAKSLVFDFYKIDAESLDSGKKGRFDFLDVMNWVNIIAITPQQEIVLVRQYRHGVDELTIEIPGGAMDPGEEDPLKTAQRELCEETGFTSERWEFLGEVTCNPAFMNNRTYTYLAIGAERNEEQNLDPLEEIEVLTIPIEEVFKMVQTEEIHHSLVVSALFHYKMWSESLPTHR